MTEVLEAPKQDITSPRPCTRCKGEGTIFHKGYSYPATETSAACSAPDETRGCTACDGRKLFPAPNFELICQQITTGRGLKEGKRKFRASFDPKLKHWSDPEAARAYYVWRMARFHGGKDMHMPWTADIVTRGDPFHKELDRMADAMAKIAFGSNMVAAHVWGSAFGIPGADPRQADPLFRMLGI